MHQEKIFNFNQILNLVSKFSSDRESNVMDGLHKLASNSGNIKLMNKNKVYSELCIPKIMIQTLKQFMSIALFPDFIVHQKDRLNLKSLWFGINQTMPSI